MINELKYSLWRSYKDFSKSDAYKGLKKIRPLQLTKQKIQGIHGKMFPPTYQLHGDPFLQKIFVKAGKEAKVTSVVETGTFMGNSTKFMAQHFPDVPIYTSEIFDKHYKISKKNLKDQKNVEIIKSNSTEFLKHLIKKGKLGERPLFFLDAHWWKYWPLADEMKIIGEGCKEAIIVIDDFKVPGNPQFKYDWYEDLVCDIDYIKPSLNKKYKYEVLFPSYQTEDFPEKKTYPQLGGYPVIFQNMPEVLKKMEKDPFVEKYFFNKSDLLKT